MKKLILIPFLVGVFNLAVAQVIYTENFDQSVDGSGYYYWSWYNQGNTTISNNVKASASELQMTLTSAGGSGQDNNAIYFTLYDTNGDIDLNMATQKKIFVTMKSTVNVVVRMDIRDDGDVATDKTPVVQSLPGDGNYHILTFDYTNKFINWQDNTVDSTMIHSLVFNFNRDVDPAVSGTVTFDKIEIGEVVASHLAEQASINSLKTYPNPSSDFVNIEMDLSTPSHVIITLSDLAGKELAVLADEQMSSLDRSFPLTGLQKGVYYISYLINGSYSKSELIMIK